MHDLLSPADVERLAGEARMSMAEVCRRAGIAQSTFTRWKANRTEPSIGVYRRIVAALRPDADVSSRPEAAA